MTAFQCISQTRKSWRHQQFRSSSYRRTNGQSRGTRATMAWWTKWCKARHARASKRMTAAAASSSMGEDLSEMSPWPPEGRICGLRATADRRILVVVESQIGFEECWCRRPVRGSSVQSILVSFLRRLGVDAGNGRRWNAASGTMWQPHRWPKSSLSCSGNRTGRTEMTPHIGRTNYRLAGRHAFCRPRLNSGMTTNQRGVSVDARQGGHGGFVTSYGAGLCCWRHGVGSSLRKGVEC